MSTNKTSFFESLKKLLKLYVTDAKLSLADKLSRALAAMAIVFIGGILGLGALLFLSIALALYFSKFMGAVYAMLVVALIYALIIVLIVIFKRSFIDDPITRMITSLMFDAPDTEDNSSSSIVKEEENEENR